MSTRAKARKAGQIVEDNTRAILILAGIGGAFYFLNKAFKGVMSALTDPGAKQEKEYNENVNKEITDYKRQGQTPSFSASTYQSAANKIYEYFNTNAGWTENEREIAIVIASMQNDIDVLELIKAFGFRRFYFTTRTANLPAWVTKYFTGDDKKYITYINELYRQKGIKYRF